MAKVANCKVRSMVQAQASFNGSNLFAERHIGKYIVYSYGYHFPIYACIGGKWYKNTDKYSVSTSRHQSQAHPLCECEGVDTRTLKGLI
jgi:hypothetical protein